MRPHPAGPSRTCPATLVPGAAYADTSYGRGQPPAADTMAHVTFYALKPRFQDLLRPVVAPLPRLGVTANVVTVAAACGSLLVGALTAWLAEWRPIFLLMPAWLLVRMALNAIDGMLAREFGQKSVLGGYLNEMGDVVSDTAL